MNELDTIDKVSNWVTVDPTQKFFNFTFLILLIVILRVVIINRREQKADRFATIETLPTKKLQDSYRTKYNEAYDLATKRLKALTGIGIHILVIIKGIFHLTNTK